MKLWGCSSGIAGLNYRRKAALAGLDLARAVDDVSVGVAANAGFAFVGEVESGTLIDFTTLGDAVNIGARVKSHASPGDMLLGSDLLPHRRRPSRRPIRNASRRGVAISRSR